MIVSILTQLVHLLLYCNEQVASSRDRETTIRELKVSSCYRSKKEKKKKMGQFECFLYSQASHVWCVSLKYTFV